MATYYVRPTNGSDVAAGTSFAVAFATTQKALDTVAAGDTVYLCPEATETTAVQIDVDGAAGTDINYVDFSVGNTTDGAEDLSLTYTIQASASMTGVLFLSNLTDYYRFRNIFFDANSNAGNVLYSTTDSAEYYMFSNCRFANATADGVNVKGNNWTFLNCEVDNNGARGIDSYTSGRGSLRMVGGSVHDNTSGGIYYNSSGQANFTDSVLIYGNGSHGIECGSSGNGTVHSHNTIYDNAGDGIRYYNASSRAQYQTYSNTFVNNTGYGVNFQAVTTDVAFVFSHNHTHNNTSGAVNPSDPDKYPQTGDPLFASAGTADFTPAAASPLVGNGISGQIIGAVMPSAAGGSSGTSILTGTGGLVS